jgi:hypothetical protein
VFNFVNTIQGDNVDLFAMKKRIFCPVYWIRRLEHLQKKLGIWAKFEPVFKNRKGENLPRGNFLKIVKACLAGMGMRVNGISGKSFRSGIPSELDKFPEDFKERHLKILGRWRSSAYQIYIRKELPEKKRVQSIIAKTLISNFSSP